MSCLPDKVGSQGRDFKTIFVTRKQILDHICGGQLAQEVETASRRVNDTDLFPRFAVWCSYCGQVFCFYCLLWMSAIQLLLVRHGNDIGRDTGHGPGNSWKMIEKVIHFDLCCVWAATADAQTESNCAWAELLVLRNCGFSIRSPDFQRQYASESSRYRHISSSVISVVVEKIILGISRI